MMFLNLKQTFATKAFMACSFLLGMAALSVPQTVFAMGINAAGYTIELYPHSPSTSDDLELSVVHPITCPTEMSLGDVIIDTLNKEVKISLEESGAGCFIPREFVLPIGKITEMGDYTIFVYADEIMPSSLIGSFPLTVTQAGAVSAIPLFSNAMLIALFLMLSIIAIRTIRTH